MKKDLNLTSSSIMSSISNIARWLQNEAAFISLHHLRHLVHELFERRYRRNGDSTTSDIMVLAYHEFSRIVDSSPATSFHSHDSMNDAPLAWSTVPANVGLPRGARSFSSTTNTVEDLINRWQGDLVSAGGGSSTDVPDPRLASLLGPPRSPLSGGDDLRPLEEQELLRAGLANPVVAAHSSSGSLLSGIPNNSFPDNGPPPLISTDERKEILRALGMEDTAEARKLRRPPARKKHMPLAMFLEIGGSSSSTAPSSRRGPPHSSPMLTTTSWATSSSGHHDAPCQDQFRRGPAGSRRDCTTSRFIGGREYTTSSMPRLHTSFLSIRDLHFPEIRFAPEGHKDHGPFTKYLKQIYDQAIEARRERGKERRRVAGRQYPEELEQQERELDDLEGELEEKELAWVRERGRVKEQCGAFAAEADFGSRGAEDGAGRSGDDHLRGGRGRAGRKAAFAEGEPAGGGGTTPADGGGAEAPPPPAGVVPPGGATEGGAGAAGPGAAPPQQDPNAAVGGPDAAPGRISTGAAAEEAQSRDPTGPDAATRAQEAQPRSPQPGDDDYDEDADLDGPSARPVGADQKQDSPECKAAKAELLAEQSSPQVVPTPSRRGEDKNF